ncbi:MAG: hypothetical protein SVY41_01455 [Candidatus Nanohaloarchaea archaeon]|nr:hypothetical protein [Candidatus Nanohaloarchaea archaeon]
MVSSHTYEDGDVSSAFPADSLLSPEERRGLDRHVSALIDIEEAPHLELLAGEHVALVPLPTSFPADYDAAPFDDDLAAIREDYEHGSEPYVLAPRDVEAIMHSMGVAPVIDASWNGESAAREVSYQLEMDYGHVTLQDGRPVQHIAYADDPAEYVAFSGEDSRHRDGEHRSAEGPVL